LIRGTQVNYYYVCKTKLWFFSHNISMEKESDLVSLGQILHTYSYPREKKNIIIDNVIGVDFVVSGEELEIHEVKRSSKLREAHEKQVLYYLYYLDKKGVKLKAVINYPKSKEIKELRLRDEDKREMKHVLKEIKKIVELTKPPKPAKTKICRSCAYFELCFSK